VTTDDAVAIEKTQFDLRYAFEAKSDQLAARMKAASRLTSHGPTIGDGSEEGWRVMLEDFLPKRYAVSQAFVVDSQGNSSLQLDAVVHDRHFTPLFWEIDGAKFLPAESVYAVFEIKPELNRGYLREAGEKVASVRGLLRTSQRIVHAGGEVMTPKPPPAILGGILARRSGWTPSFGQPLKDGLDGLDASQRLDLGCGLADGAFEVPAGLTAKDGLTTADAAVGLAFFAMRLLARLQRMGTVPALDIDAYTRVLSR
jgi:hypothetical protein